MEAATCPHKPADRPPSGPGVSFGRIAAGALLGSALGAAAWALIGAYVSFAPGLLAWCVGLIAGVSTSLFGGRGNGPAAVCALIAVFGVILGRPVLSELRYRFQLEDAFSKQLSQAEYARFAAMAEAFAAGVSDAELPGFMVANGLTAAGSPEEVRPEEVARFRDHFVPAFRRFAELRPSYETWREEIIGNVVPVIEGARRARGTSLPRFDMLDILVGAAGIAAGYIYVAVGGAGHARFED